MVDDGLKRFEAEGAPLLPPTEGHGYVEHDGARIWYSAHGSGPPVVLLHGGLGHSGNWGYQVPALVAQGFRVIVIDTRGHGRSTRDERPFSYELLASDVLAVVDTLQVELASLIGWSDGAIVALILAMQAPNRVSRVVFFGCAMDQTGLKEIDDSDPILSRVFGRHAVDYRQLSATPHQFEQFATAVQRMMEHEPKDYGPGELARISVPVTIVHSEHDEFIKREHAGYLANVIPNARLVELDDVSHFAPLQRPDTFNAMLVDCLESSKATDE